MQLMIFDREINFKGIVENQFSFRRVRRYSKCGEFELHTSFNLDTFEMLSIGNIIYTVGDLEGGYIEYRNIKIDEQGKEVLVVKGRFITGYLANRIVWGTENLNDTVENGIRSIINNNAINPTDSDRKIPLLELGELKSYTDTIKRQSSYKNLLEEIEKISISNELGIRTMLDINSKRLIFDIYKGIDRSNQVVFSKDFENILGQEYTGSVYNYKNTALIAGKGEGEAREKVSIVDGVGLDRKEMFVDAKDLNNDGVVPTVYTEMLSDRGKTKLAEMAKVESFDSKVNLKSNYIYKVDYDLGDIVTIKNKKWNLTIDTRITEIQEVYEEDGFNIFITFGNEIPDILDKIRMVI